MEQIFADPVSVGEGEQRSTALLKEIETIQVQLGDHNRTNTDGVRLTQGEYWEWRKKANRARMMKLWEYRQIKAWMKNKAREK